MLIFENAFGGWWCVGVAIAICVMIFVKLFLSRQSTSAKKPTKKIKKGFLWVVSPDFCVSKWQKEKIKQENDLQHRSSKTEDKTEKKLSEYIRKQNSLNLYTSMIIAGIALVVAIFPNSVLWQIFWGLLCYRALSRTMEINIAFFKDVISTEEKNSDLTSQDRIILAMKSLIEEFLLFFGIYQLLQDYNIGYAKRFFFALFNASRSFLPTFPSLECSRLFNGICIYQNICGFILISLSLITYISQLGDKSSKTNKDESTNSSGEETKNSD